MEEFGKGGWLELAALTIRATVGCANPEPASSPKVRMIAKRVFTCVFSFPVGSKFITTLPRLAAGRRTPPRLLLRPVPRVLELVESIRFPICGSILYTNVVCIILDIVDNVGPPDGGGERKRGEEDGYFSEFVCGIVLMPGCCRRLAGAADAECVGHRHPGERHRRQRFYNHRRKIRIRHHGYRNEGPILPDYLQWRHQRHSKSDSQCHVYDSDCGARPHHDCPPGPRDLRHWLQRYQSTDYGHRFKRHRHLQRDGNTHGRARGRPAWPARQFVRNHEPHQSCGHRL
jgi:hypothetical protein